MTDPTPHLDRISGQVQYLLRSRALLLEIDHEGLLSYPRYPRAHLVGEDLYKEDSTDFIGFLVTDLPKLHRLHDHLSEWVYRERVHFDGDSDLLTKAGSHLNKAGV